MSIRSQIQVGHSLSTLVEQTERLQQVRRLDLCPGDSLFVKTHNSLYHMRVVSDGTYLVSGGWFDRKGHSPMKIRVAGCTWGGSAIKVDIIAACGLCVEFGNKVVTSAVQKITIMPRGMQN